MLRSLSGLLSVMPSFSTIASSATSAAAYLRGQEGVLVRPLSPRGPPEPAGLTNFFFETPWGQLIEVLTFNGPLAYEADTSPRLRGLGISFADR